MKKINSWMLVLLMLMLSTILLATSCGKQSSEENISGNGDKVCEHIWSDATCTVAKSYYTRPTKIHYASFSSIHSSNSSYFISPAAKAKGVRFGRSKKHISDDFGKIVISWEQKRLPLSEVLKSCNMSDATLYRRLREYRLL